MKKRYLLLSSLVSLNLVACQPATLPTGSMASNGTAAGMAEGVTLSLQLVTARGMSTLALPGQNTVHDFKVTVKLPTPAPAGTVIEEPVVSASGLRDGSFQVQLTKLQTNTTYELVVDARDQVGTSVLKNTGTATITVGADGTINGGTPVSVNIAYKDGTAETTIGPIVTLSNPTVGSNFATATHAGMALVNEGNQRSTAQAAVALNINGGGTAKERKYTLKNVQQGSVTAANNTHSLWTYFTDGALASLPQRLALPEKLGGAKGTISDTDQPSSPRLALTATPLHSLAVAPTHDQRLHLLQQSLAGSIEVYAIDNGKIGRFDGIAHTIIKLADGALDASASTMTATKTGHIYYYNGGTISRGTMGAAPELKFTAVATIATLAGAPTISHLSNDASGCLYWIQGGEIMKLVPGATAANAVFPNQGGGLVVTSLAVDAYGNIYYAVSDTTNNNNRNVYKAKLGNDEVTYSLPAVEATFGAAISGLTVDTAGNVYSKEGAVLKFHANGNPAATVYSVASWPVAVTSFDLPTASNGSLYIANTTGGNFVVTKID